MLQNLTLTTISLFTNCFWCLQAPTAYSDKRSSVLTHTTLQATVELYKTDTSVKWTPRVGPCLSVPPLIASL